MATDVVSEITIDRAVDVVAAYAADPANAPEWYKNIQSIEFETPPPLAVGSRLAFVARFLRRRLAYTYEVIELVPGERLVMRTAEERSTALSQSPKQIPRSRAVTIVSQSIGTVRSLLMADTRGTKFTWGGSRATITPR